MMRYGIPKYRLPRDVLDAEIESILSLGIEVQTGRRIEDVEAVKRDGGFDAVYLALGAQLARRAYIPAADSAHILDALSFLASAEGGADAAPRIGRRVIVYGGGNTAMDSARTARRLGATEAVVVYRRTREQMPAHESELEEALAEGIEMTWLSTLASIEDGAVVIEKMVLDESGFPQPTGEYETLGADTVVLALGQEADLSAVESLGGVATRDGMLEVGADMSTGVPGVFAGGDMVPADRTATVAIGHGKKAARAIGAWLRGGSLAHATRHELASFDKLNTWYYDDAPRTVQGELEFVRRQNGFEEVVAGLDVDSALFEARRCLSCGNCFECDNCFGVCPDNAVVKLGPGERYAFDYDYCKGCGICVSECPCGAIVMVPETI